MLDNENKYKFIELRANNISYDKIANELNISKTTLLKWGKELETDIARYKVQELNNIYEIYALTKQARLKQLGKSLDKVCKAIDKIDFNELPPQYLLDYHLKLIKELKEENIISDAKPLTSIEPNEIMQELCKLVDACRVGNIDYETALKDSKLLNECLAAYNAVEMKTKINGLIGALK